MALVECIRGPAKTVVGGTEYHFHRDALGRYVAEVERFHDLSCLLSVEHYREVEPVDPAIVRAAAEDDPLQEPPKTKPGKAKGGKAKSAPAGAAAEERSASETEGG